MSSRRSNAEIRYNRCLDPAGRLVGPLPPTAYTADQLIALYRAMVRTRSFDSKAIALQRTGRLGTFPSSLGRVKYSVTGQGSCSSPPGSALIPWIRNGLTASRDSPDRSHANSNRISPSSSVPQPFVARCQPNPRRTGRVKPEAATGGGTPPSNRFSRSPLLLGGRGDLGTDAAPSRLNQPIDPHAPRRNIWPECCSLPDGDRPEATDLDGTARWIGRPQRPLKNSVPRPPLHAHEISVFLEMFLDLAMKGALDGLTNTPG